MSCDVSFFGAIGAGVGLRGSVGIGKSARQTRHRVPEFIVPVMRLRVLAQFASCLFLLILSIYGHLYSTVGILFVLRPEPLCIYTV